MRDLTVFHDLHASHAQGVFSPSVISGREVIFYENHVGELASFVAGGLSNSAAAFGAAARDGALNHTTLREVRLVVKSYRMYWSCTGCSCLCTEMCLWDHVYALS